MWDVKGNCAKGRSKEALQINRELDNIKAQIIKHYQHLSDREAFVTAEMVRNSYQGFGSEYETLLSAFDKDIANQKKRVGKDRVASTLWAMERSRKDVAEFIQSHYRRTDMSMQELTPEFIYDEDIEVVINREDEEFYRLAAKLITERYNAYAQAYKGRKSDHIISLMTLIDIALMYQKERSHNDTAPYNDVLARLTAEIESALGERK